MSQIKSIVKLRDSESKPSFASSFASSFAEATANVEATAGLKKSFCMNNNFSFTPKLGVQKILLMLALCLTFPAFNISALPFNDDMVDNQLTPGQIMRTRPVNSRPIGIGEIIKSTSKEDSLKLTNPVKATKESVLRGERLFQVNCSACHGEIGKVHVPYPAGLYMGAPNLADPLYHDRTEGNIYGTIHFGNAIMPAVGWKISANESWDIINYVKSKQQENSKLNAEKEAEENSNTNAATAPRDEVEPRKESEQK